MKAQSLFAIALFCGGNLHAQRMPLQMLFTAEGMKGQAPPELTADDIRVRPNKGEFRISDVTPMRGEHAGLQLAIFIDDGSDSSLGLQYDDLRRFIRQQPSTTQIGVYYIRNGSAQPAQAITSDHEAAAASLRLPLGQPGIAVSPSTAISEFIKKWPPTGDRREILLISSGIDLDREPPTQNPYLTTAIADAQRARVLVNSIYFASAGHGGHDYYLTNFGRDYLSYLGDETGGEAYWEGLATSVSLKPYFDDLNTRLQNQYLLTMTATAQKKPRFERIRLLTEHHGVELMAQDQVWIPAEK